MRNVTPQNLYVLSRKVISVLLVLVTTFSLLFATACFSKEDSEAFSNLITTFSNSKKKLVVDDDDILNEIGSEKDLFTALQDNLYMFSPYFYIRIDSYDLFQEYWSDLYDSGALNSAFVIGDIKVEYNNESPCLMKMSFSYNSTGQILQALVNQSTMTFSDADTQELYSDATMILSSIIDPEMSTLEKELVIHDYLVLHSQYSTTGDSDVLATAYSVIVNGEGQCQGYSEAFVLLCELEGIPARVISGTALDQDGEYAPHAWNQVQIDSVWYHVDVTWDDPIPDTENYVSELYANRSDEIMKADHIWSPLFPTCYLDLPSSDVYE